MKGYKVLPKSSDFSDIEKLLLFYRWRDYVYFNDKYFNFYFPSWRFFISHLVRIHWGWASLPFKILLEGSRAISGETWLSSANSLKVATLQHVIKAFFVQWGNAVGKLHSPSSASSRVSCALQTHLYIHEERKHKTRLWDKKRQASRGTSSHIAFCPVVPPAKTSPTPSLPSPHSRDQVSAALYLLNARSFCYFK